VRPSILPVILTRGSRVGGAAPFNPSSLNPLQRFLDASPTYHGSTVANYPVLTPEEAYTSIAQPRSGRCWLFDGSNDFAVGAIAGTYSTLTYAFWIKPNGLPANEAGIVFNRSSGVSGVHFQAAGSLRLGYTWNSEKYDWAGGPVLTDAVWQHVVVVITPTDVKFYINGVLSVTRVSAHTSNQALAAVNVGRDAIGRTLNGSLKDVLIDDEGYTDAEVLSLATNHTVPSGKTPLAFYRCEEESGTTGYNSLANSNHLTLTNITQCTFHALDTGVRYSDANERGHSKIMNFDGVDDFASLSSFTLEPPYTISTWFKANALTGPKGIVSWGEEAANKRRSLIVWNGGSGAYKFYSSQYANNIAGATSISAGVWYHAAITVAVGGACVVYVNGVSDGTGTHSPATPTSQPLYIGRTADGTELVNGQVGATRIYNVVKTAGEISAIYAGTNDTTGLQARYSDQYDESGNNRHLTLSGASVSVIPRSVATPTQDVLGDTLGVTGPVAKLATAEVRCVTGNGTNAYLDCGSALIPATADFDMSLWAYYSYDTTPRTIFSQTGAVAIRFVFNWNGSFVGTAGYLWIDFGGAYNGYAVPSLSTTGWYLMRFVRTGGSLVTYVNGIAAATITANPTLTVTNSTRFLIGEGGTPFSDGRISDLRITTGGVTKYFPLQEGPGTANTNRNIHWVGSDGTGGVISNAIVNGTVSNIWANYCPFAQDHCINHGGGIAANGSFIPGRIGSNLDAAGNAKTLVAGKHGNPYSRLVPNVWNMPSLVIRGVDSADRLAPSTTYESLTTATDDAFNRIRADGSDRYFLTPAALTGADLTNADGYVA